MTLDPRDHKLSMKVSPRAKEENRNEGLRTLILNRLRDAEKAVLRLPLKRNIATADEASAYNVHCEPCDIWFRLPDWGEEVRCPGKCKGLYVLESAVFSKVEEGGRDS
jgi:hypothetical protein